MTLPERFTDGDIEDINSVDYDLASLVERFIKPIDRLRSFNAPLTLLGRASRRTATDSAGITKAIAEDLRTSSFNPVEAQESRAHAFYRMIGLPVMASDFSFYNPGFNPTRTEKARTANYSVSNKVSQDITLIQSNREFSARSRRDLFKKQPIDSAILAVVFDIPKKFQVIDTNKTFSMQDPQAVSIPKRKTFLNATYTDHEGNELDQTFFVHNSHILRPFLTDPTIVETIMPRSKMVCEPFLKDKNSTKIEDNTFLTRPGIEFVLRKRLTQTPIDPNDIANEIILSLDSEAEISDLTISEKKQLISALLDENKIGGQQVSELFNTNFEIIQINKLIKTIKSLIFQLVKNLYNLDEVRRSIDWTPLPSENGFEDPAGLILSGLLRSKIHSSELERRIGSLTVKAGNAKRQAVLKFPDSDFAISMYERTEQLWDNELNELIEQKNHFIRSGAESLAAIEYITGEVSGLGLVDILAVYTALWAIDLDVLLSLLDTSAFDRLYEFNPELRNANVKQRKNSGPVFSADDAMKRFEAQIISILSFSDKEFNRLLSSPNASEGGEP